MPCKQDGYFGQQDRTILQSTGEEAVKNMVGIFALRKSQFKQPHSPSLLYSQRACAAVTLLLHCCCKPPVCCFYESRTFGPEQQMENLCPTRLCDSRSRVSATFASSQPPLLALRLHQSLISAKIPCEVQRLLSLRDHPDSLGASSGG